MTGTNDMYEIGDRVRLTDTGEHGTVIGVAEALPADEESYYLVKVDGLDEITEAGERQIGPPAEEPEEEPRAPFHVYEVRAGGRLTPVLATCEGDSLGFTLRTLREEGQLSDDSRIGVLYRPEAGEPGTWLINPYAAGRT